ncbi:MAG: hypothetical protein V2I67_09595 [Thermoanaerobaculales bacterium]|jgi:hypothetical protein|nr:hypothetical protein [Thermoanaerobaculales bacterium]
MTTLLGRRCAATTGQVEVAQNAGAEGWIRDDDHVSRHPRWAKAHPT